MDEKGNIGSFERVPWMIQKAAQISAQEITEAELKAINKYTLEPLRAEDVFTFKAVLCDNEIDRDFECFSTKTLQDLCKLFLGKTVIKNHEHSTDNQMARIYATELVQENKTTKTGEMYVKLVAHCYMVKTSSNTDLIAEIKGGIKKEGSIGCVVSSSICSICGTDNRKGYCAHYPGRNYEKDGRKQVCTFTLAGASDAYEFSLVAVPAQRAAGVSKNYTGKVATEDDKEFRFSEEEETAKKLMLRARLVAARIRSKN